MGKLVLAINSDAFVAYIRFERDVQEMHSVHDWGQFKIGNHQYNLQHMMMFFFFM